jgi:hypothetical protein
MPELSADPMSVATAMSPVVYGPTLSDVCVGREPTKRVAQMHVATHEISSVQLFVGSLQQLRNISRAVGTAGTSAAISWASATQSALTETTNTDGVT